MRLAIPGAEYNLKMAWQSPITIKELVEQAGISLDYLNSPFRKDRACILAKFYDPWENFANGYHLGLLVDDICHH